MRPAIGAAIELQSLSVGEGESARLVQTWTEEMAEGLEYAIWHPHGLSQSKKNLMPSPNGSCCRTDTKEDAEQVATLHEATLASLTLLTRFGLLWHPLHEATWWRQTEQRSHACNTFTGDLGEAQSRPMSIWRIAQPPFIQEQAKSENRPVLTFQLPQQAPPFPEKPSRAGSSPG